MNFLRKLAAIVIMILSVIGLVLCVGGIFGAWAVNEPATQGILSALDTADQYLAVAEQTSSMARATVGDVSTRLAEIAAAVPIVAPNERAALAARVQELAAPVQRISSTALALEAGLTSLNDTLTTVSRLPGLNIDPPPAQLVEVSRQLGVVGQRLDAVEAALSEVSGDGARISALIGDASSELAQVESRLQQLNANVATAQQVSAIIEARAAPVLDLASLGMTLFLMLMAAGQISLLAHGWGWFKN